MRMLTKLAVAAAASLAVPATAQAAVVVNITEAGGNVVTALSGSLDLTGLTNKGVYTLGVALRGDPAYFGTGAPDASVTAYSGFTGPTSFGDSTLAYASSSSGDDFAFNAGSFGSPYVFVGTGYASGSALLGSSTYAGTSLAALGLTAGSYVYTFGSETITFNIGSAVPEPGTWALMIAGLGVVGGVLRRRPAARTSVRFA